MTLRNAWEWTVDYWQGYYTTVTNSSVLDWPISYIAWSAVALIAAFYAFVLAMALIVVAAEALQITRLFKWIDRKINYREYSWFEIILIFFAVIIVMLLLVFVISIIGYALN